MMAQQRCLTLTKGREEYVFTYYEGCEGELLAALIASASDEQSGFDWIDAAVLGYELSQRTEPLLETVR